MYNHQFIGSKANSGAVQKVDGGIILNGGTIASSRSTSKGIETLGFHSGVQGAAIIVSSTFGVAKALSSGTLAKMVRGSYVMRRVTTTLAGVANTSIYFGGSRFHRVSINKVRNLRTSHLYAYGWTADDESGETWAATYHNNNVTSGITDDAASPTRAIPGEFTMLQAGVTPTNLDYPAKT